MQKPTFRAVVIFLATCFQVIIIYVQSVHSGLDVMQGRHLGLREEGGLKGSMDPQGFTILVFFPVNRAFEMQCYCCKNNTLRRLRPQESLRSQQFTEMTPLT